MPLELDEVRRIAQDVASAHDRNLQIVGASVSEGGSGYTELIVVDAACAAEPCRLMIGVDRSGSASQFRSAVDEQIRDQILKRRQE